MFDVGSKEQAERGHVRRIGSVNRLPVLLLLHAKKAIAEACNGFSNVDLLNRSGFIAFPQRKIQPDRVPVKIHLGEHSR